MAGIISSEPEKSRIMQSQGFSLLELLIVVMIVGVMAVLAAPMWRHLWQRHQLTLSTISLVRSIHYAQLTALLKHEDVSLCGSRDGQHCDGDWSAGRIIIKDHQVLYHFRRLFEQVMWRSSLGRNDRLDFGSLGFSQQQGTFYLCQGKKQGVTVSVNFSGRTRVNEKDGRVLNVCL